MVTSWHLEQRPEKLPSFDPQSMTVDYGEREGGREGGRERGGGEKE